MAKNPSFNVRFRTLASECEQRKLPSFLFPAVLSIPVFHLRPRLLQIEDESTAKKNREPFVATRIRVLCPAHNLHTLEVFAIAASIAAEDNHGATVIIAWSPIPISLVIADRFGKAVLRPEEID